VAILREVGVLKRGELLDVQLEVTLWMKDKSLVKLSIAFQGVFV